MEFIRIFRNGLNVYSRYKFLVFYHDHTSAPEAEFNFFTFIYIPEFLVEKGRRMKDLREIAGNSIFARNSVVLYTLIMATLGGVNAIWEICKKWEDSHRPKQAEVLIEAIDFQNKQFDKVVFNFRNATKESTSINNVGLLCKNALGQILHFHALNNEVSKHKQIFDIGKFDTTPKLLKSGESIRLDVLFYKTDSVQPINQQCKSIAPFWSDNEFKKHTGKFIGLSNNSVVASFVVFEQS